MGTVLLVAEPGAPVEPLKAALAEAGHEVLQVPPQPEALPGPESGAEVVVVAKSARNGGDRLVRHVKSHPTLRYSPVLVLAPDGSQEDRLAALEIGADDYLPWPSAAEEVRARLMVMLRIRNLYRELLAKDTEAQLLRDQVEQRHSFENIIGTSYAMRRVFDLVSKVTATNTTVLITGESGTGKELVARAIHYNSPRRHNNFVIQNCSVFNDNLLESELFGHVKGSFTGAIADKKGLFEVADGGTLFLDEVGDMSPALQVKVLRVLQEGTFIPVGGTQAKTVDVRVISATNRPLEDLVREGTFREDLYYRLNVFNIHLPPLRERREDIPLLARHFLEVYCSENNLPLKSLEPEVLDAFYAYEWPGNVRELENEIERAVVLAREEAKVTLEHLSPRIRQAAAERKSHRGRRLEGKLTDALRELECAMLAEGLERNNWNKSRTARQLGISRANLVAKVKKYGLRPNSSRNGDRDARTR